MPLTYRIDRDAGVLIIHGDGTITQQERIDALRAWTRDPAFGDCTAAICDVSAAASTPQLSDVRELVRAMGDAGQGRGPARLAMVTPRPIALGVARVFQDLVHFSDRGLEVRTFDDADAAWTWLRRPRVLIADDYAPMVVALERLLSMECDVVGSVSDCGALLEAVRRLKPDVVVLDLNLAGGNSLSACQEITRNTPRVTVIVVTGGVDPTLRANVLDAGAAAFIEKHAAPTGLLTAIVQARARRPDTAPPSARRPADD